MNEPLRVCAICKQTVTQKDRIGRLQGNHHRLQEREFDLVECPSCGLIYITPAPTVSDIRAMYTESTQFDQDEVYRGERGGAALDFYTGRLRALLMEMGRPEDAKLRVLEVGAGLSWMCHAAKRLNQSSVTVAQDITKETVEECRWVDHYCIEELMNSPGIDAEAPYDIASMTHVIEHLVDPVGALRRIRSLMADNSLTFVTAPHRPVGWTRRSPISDWQAWSYNHVPAHIQYFSLFSMQRAAKETGFTTALWDSDQEDGQAFEAWLRPAPRGWARIWAAVRGKHG